MKKSQQEIIQVKGKETKKTGRQIVQFETDWMDTSEVCGDMSHNSKGKRFKWIKDYRKCAGRKFRRGNKVDINFIEWEEQ